MKIAVVAVGRIRRGPERALFEHYRDRIGWTVELREVEEKRALPTAKLVAREAELLRAAIPTGATVVALDRAGEALSSEAFARRVAAWRDGGARWIAVVIGGADGLDRSLVRDAELAWSFGAVTWPHLLVRGMLAEQLYRTQQILAGHPYHR